MVSHQQSFSEDLNCAQRSLNKEDHNQKNILAAWTCSLKLNAKRGSADLCRLSRVGWWHEYSKVAGEWVENLSSQKLSVFEKKTNIQLPWKHSRRPVTTKETRTYHSGLLSGLVQQRVGEAYRPEHACAKRTRFARSRLFRAEPAFKHRVQVRFMIDEYICAMRLRIDVR